LHVFEYDPYVVLTKTLVRGRPTGQHERRRRIRLVPASERGGEAMSIVVRFNPKNVTREKYDEVVHRLEQAGEWPHPPGLEFHVLYGSEGELRVSEIWDSRESLEAYG